MDELASTSGSPPPRRLELASVVAARLRWEDLEASARWGFPRPPSSRSRRPPGWVPGRACRFQPPWITWLGATWGQNQRLGSEQHVTLFPGGRKNNVFIWSLEELVGNLRGSSSHQQEPVGGAFQCVTGQHWVGYVITVGSGRAVDRKDSLITPALSTCSYAPWNIQLQLLTPFEIGYDVGGKAAASRSRAKSGQQQPVASWKMDGQREGEGGYTFSY
nr:PREDICTED: uncharacterized protein LOC106701616 [Bos mutus]